MPEPLELDPSTLAVSLGRPAHQPGAALSVPPVLSSTYVANGDLTYGRDGNATWLAFEEVLGALEGGTALAFASGLAAVAAVLEMQPVGAAVVVAHDAYNGTRRFLADVETRGRLRSIPADITDTAATINAVERERAAVLWLESPTNPQMQIADLTAQSAGAHDLGTTVVVDNTFATPLLQRPLDLGADIVVHSVTKFLAGHSDIVMGATVARDPELSETLATRRGLHGAIPGPFETYLALRGVRTLPVRLERSQSTAAELARRLTEHPAVARVRYPGLPDDPGHQLAAKQMKGFGAMLAFDTIGAAEQAEAVCNATRLAVHATSLGGVETLLERRNRYTSEKETPPTLIRVSVGLEHVDDLWADFDQALLSVFG
jgi:cystathionine gamma-synthase